MAHYHCEHIKQSRIDFSNDHKEYFKKLKLE